MICHHLYVNYKIRRRFILRRLHDSTERANKK